MAAFEPRRADHISVQNDGELSRRVLCHEKALFFEFGASASRYYRRIVGGSERTSAIASSPDVQMSVSTYAERPVVADSGRSG